MAGRELGSKNKPVVSDIDQARKMARIKASEAGPIWGIPRNKMSLLCVTGKIQGAAKFGKTWFVTPTAMDNLFRGRK